MMATIADAATVRYHRKYMMLWPSVSLVEELRTLDAIEAMAGFDNGDYDPDVVENSAIETSSVRQAIREILDYRERNGVEVPDPTYGIPHETIEAVKTRRPVEAEIELSTDLRRAGRSLRGECPMQCALAGSRSAAPALAVWPVDGRWHCFRCAVGGDVIDYVMSHQRWEFPQAVRHLAGVTGVELPEPARKNVRMKDSASESGKRHFRTDAEYHTHDSVRMFEYRSGKVVGS